MPFRGIVAVSAIEANYYSCSYYDSGLAADRQGAQAENASVFEANLRPRHRTRVDIFRRDLC